MSNSSIDPAIEAIFGAPPNGIDLSENTACRDTEAVISLFVLATVACILRLYARFLQHSKMFANDWVILPGLLYTGGAAAMGIAGGHYGAGRHVWSLTDNSLVMMFRVMYVYVYLYGSSVSTSKVSILLFYQCIFTTGNQTFRIPVASGYVFAVGYWIAVTVSALTFCKPLDYFWKQFTGTATGKCLSTNKFFFAMGILNMVGDLYILAIPIPQIMALQMSLHKKLAVIGIMLLGIFACVASIVRIYYLAYLISAVDITYSIGPLFIWSVVEPAIAIVCACLPHLVPLRHVIRKKLSTKFGSKEGTKRNNHESRSQWNDADGANSGGVLYTFGGSRFNNGKHRLVGADDEIELTTRVGVAGKSSTHSNSIEDMSDGGPGNSRGILVKSTVVHTSCPKY